MADSASYLAFCWEERVGTAVNPVSPSDMRVETIAILPGGTVHRAGGILRVGRAFADSVRTAWQAAQRTSADLGTPLVARVGYPNGQIEARLIRGWERPLPAPADTHAPVNDPRWDDPIPDRLDLLGAIRAAQRAGQVRAAEVTASALVGALRSDLGDHPHTCLTIEEQARCAAEAHRWDRATVLHTEAAVLRHRLGSPAAAEAEDVRRAVAAWLRTTGTATNASRDATEPGFLLAHTLIGLCPAPQDLGVLLRRLAEHLLAQ